MTRNNSIAAYGCNFVDSLSVHWSCARHILNHLLPWIKGYLPLKLNIFFLRLPLSFKVMVGIKPLSVPISSLSRSDFISSLNACLKDQKLETFWKMYWVNAFWRGIKPLFHRTGVLHGSVMKCLTHNPGGLDPLCFSEESPLAKHFRAPA